MNFNRSIWYDAKANKVAVIDQQQLPFKQVVFELQTLEDVVKAIKEMVVRGAPLIGVTAAYGMYLAAKEHQDLNQAYLQLLDTRPTAVNLAWALNRQMNIINNADSSELISALLDEAQRIEEEDIEMCSKIGDHGLKLLDSLFSQKKRQINILTHCNAGWLATVKWGTALAPVYKAHTAGIPLHVWVDETRPRNQGAKLTAWELEEAKIPYHVIADNVGGHLMQHGMVDIVIVGSDRTTKNGDVCNKIGTYLKALAAHDNNIPFYAALPVSTIDWNVTNGLKEIEIEERNSTELTNVDAWINNTLINVPIMHPSTPVCNFAFDVTPAKFVTGIITEKGIAEASEKGLRKLYPLNL